MSTRDKGTGQLSTKCYAYVCKATENALLGLAQLHIVHPISNSLVFLTVA